MTITLGQLTPTLELTDDRVIGQLVLEGIPGTIGFRAERVREERTGVHARVSILVNDVPLATDHFNVERDAERLRLCNSAHKHFDPILAKALPPNHLKFTFDRFCGGIWEVSLGVYAPEMLTGAVERQAPEMVIDPYVISGGGTILFAPPGRGKSFIALLMAVSVDADVGMLFSVRDGPVLVIQIERSRASQQRRLGDINAALGLDRERPMAFLNARGQSLATVITSADRHVKERGTQLVVLDSISRSGFGDLNENRPANQIVDALNRLAPSWLAIAHTPRSDDSHVFGSMHFEAGADIMMQLVSQAADNRLGIGLEVMQANDIRPAPLALYGLSFDEKGLTGAWKASQQEFPELAARKKVRPLEAVREYLLEVGKADAQTIGEAVGMPRAEVSRMLNSAPGIGSEWDARRKMFFVLQEPS